MSTHQSLSELREQARVNDHNWPLWLHLRQRQLESLLAETNGVWAELLDMLREAKLPLPEQLPRLSTPIITPIDGTEFQFASAITGCLHLMREHDTQHQRTTLMSVAATEQWYIDHAVQGLNQLLTDYPTARVIAAAQLWVSLHTGQVPTLQWETVQQTTDATGWE